MSDLQTGRSMANVRQIEAIERYFRDREARWWDTIRPLLEVKPRTSHDLVLAIGRENWREGAKLTAWLRKLERGGLIVRGGTTLAPTGHINIVWALKP